MTDEEKAKAAAEEAAKAKAIEAAAAAAAAAAGKTEISMEEHRKLVAEVVEERESFKKKFRDMRTKVEEFEEKFKTLPSSSTIEKLIEEKKQLEEFRRKTEEEAEKKRLADASETEKLQFEIKKLQDAQKALLAAKEDEFGSEIKKTKEELEKSSKTVSKLLDYKKEMEILRAAEKYGAYKPSQIVGMVATEIVYDSDTDTFVKYLYNERGKKDKELTVDEFVKTFLEKPENDNLRKSNVQPGSGTTPTKPEFKAGGEVKLTEAEKKKLAEEAEERGMTLEKWIETKARIEAAREKKKK
jgi:hypothetical protein